VHHHRENDHDHDKGSQALRVRAHQHKKPAEWLLKSHAKKVDTDRKTKFYDPTAQLRTKHPLFKFGQRMIHNAKVLLRNTTDSEGGVGASDSFVLADHDAKLLVKGHSDYLRRMQRHAGPDICLAKARSLVANKLNVAKVCSSLMCTAAYTLAYTVGVKHDLPTPGCQMVEVSKSTFLASLNSNKKNVTRDPEKAAAKYENFLKSAKSSHLQLENATAPFVFFCNAKFPKLIPSVLELSGFVPVKGKPGFWRQQEGTSAFPGRIHHHRWNQAEGQ
jgi:hypothetical protein